MSALFFKILKPKAGFYGVGYNEKKERQGTAERVHFENFGYLQERSVITKEDFKKYLETYSSQNKTIKLKQFHAVLSCKGHAYTFEALKDHALEIMLKLGYGENPLLIYGHSDTKNNHVHIVTSRVGPNGIKIPHDFEGIRANKIVSEILGVNRKESFEETLERALSYTFSSKPGFLLLMEKSGYQHKQNGETITFYKHGGVQGEVALKLVNDRILFTQQGRGEPSSIRAILHKYKITISPVLSKIDFGVRTTAKPVFRSELTDYLRDKLALEFVFHGSENKDQPYGYTLIDHKNKAIYKGSEVINWSVLMDGAKVGEKPLNEVLGPSKGNPTDGGKMPSRKREGVEREIDLNVTRSDDKFFIPSQAGFSMDQSSLHHFDQLIEQGLRENEIAGKRVGKKRKKKKRGIS